MSLIDYDSIVAPTAQETSVKVMERVSVTSLPSTSRGHLMRPDSEWTWSDLRDYVISEIEKCSGVFPRNQRKEQGIFNRFHSEFGPEESAAIARHAFEVCNGWWANAPISVNRFCRGSDDFFARPILSKLTQ